MELSSSKIKKFLIILQVKLFSLIFQRSKGNFPSAKNKKELKKFLMFWEMELSGPKLKKLLYFRRKL